MLKKNLQQALAQLKCTSQRVKLGRVCVVSLYMFKCTLPTNKVNLWNNKDNVLNKKFNHMLLQPHR